MATKKNKKIKKTPTPKIRKKLLREWSEKVRHATGERCAICGMKSGFVLNGTKQKIDAHHIEEKTTCQRLRFDLLNGIPLCVRHHKWGKDAAHNSPVFFIKWLIENKPKQIDYIYKNRKIGVDINDREYLDSLIKTIKTDITPEEINTLNLKSFFEKLQYVENDFTFGYYNLFEQDITADSKRA